MIIKLKKALQLIGIIMIGVFLVTVVVGFARDSSERVRAEGPIPPPEGAPKLSLSTKVVTPTLTSLEEPVLTYIVTILNTGAYPASGVMMTDVIPQGTVYNNDAWSSAPPEPAFNTGTGVLSWGPGEVGFDDFVEIHFSVTVQPDFEGTIVSNTAVINCPDIPAPVTVTAEARITDHPMFEVAKTSAPDLPGPNQPLTYELAVTNVGQDAVGTAITVTDMVPTDTTFLAASDGGTFNQGWVTWESVVDLPFGETTNYTFSVTVADVPSGTVIDNHDYLVVGPQDIFAGEPVTTTVVDPIFIISKGIFPDPPGSNREMTYTLTVLNLGSNATDLVITDEVPSEVEYLRCAGGECEHQNGVVTWQVDSLDTRQTVDVNFTVYVEDIADVPILNGNYRVCSDGGAGVCADGLPVSSLIVPPVFEVTATLDPIAHKPGGGETEVTPTLTINNIGPGNALDANALLTLGNISAEGDVIVIPSVGILEDLPPCDMGNKCLQFWWTGDVVVGDVITFTTNGGQSTVGGGEGTPYTATIVVTDTLGAFITDPATATAIGHVTHLANLIPTKSAPAEIGAGQEMTYTIEVFNSGLSTEEEPVPTLTETVPSSVTLLTVSHDGTWETIGEDTVITWELPPLSPGEVVDRAFNVLVDDDLVSGTLIVNDDYRTSWFESDVSGTLTNTFSILGEPVTTTVREVGLIDSYKTVTPTWALPGEDILLTYALHVVNSGPHPLDGVELNDVFPWEHTTYLRDAVASAGTVISDIVSLEWTGDLAPYSEAVITFTAVVDDYFEGVVTNTATISHDSLLEDKVITALAYITDKPVLQISKVATPSPVAIDGTLLYHLQVTNLAQQATRLVITDTIPLNTTYVQGSASSGGQVVDGVVTWIFPVLNPGATLNLTFQVTVNSGTEVVNDSYAVTCDEGVSAYGDPVVTPIRYLLRRLLLPVIYRE